MSKGHCRSQSQCRRLSFVISFRLTNTKPPHPRGERVPHTVPPIFDGGSLPSSLWPVTGASGTLYSARQTTSISRASSQVVFAGFALRGLSVKDPLSLQQLPQLLVLITADTKAHGWSVGPIAFQCQYTAKSQFWQIHAFYHGLRFLAAVSGRCVSFLDSVADCVGRQRAGSAVPGIVCEQHSSQLSVAVHPARRTDQHTLKPSPFLTFQAIPYIFCHRAY